jgi:hypothetical protein
MTTLVQQYMDSIAWYQPTTDTDDWQFFFTACKSVDYSTGTVDTLVKVADHMLQMQPGLDQGMWAGWQANLSQFAQGVGPTLPELTAEYQFIACFKNEYWAASHNNDLWQSFNDRAHAFSPPA